jgi:hypothetical protein
MTPTTQGRGIADADSTSPGLPRLRMIASACALGAAVLLGACASKGAAPVEQLTRARASIAQAESAGAQQAAPLELLSSREKLGKAEVAVKDEKYGAARAFAEESQADAELAERKARVAKAQAAADELARSNQQLSNEAQRSAKP